MTRAFAHDGLSISAEAAEDDLIWLDEFLSPAFHAGSIDSAEAHVEFSASASPIFDLPSGDPPPTDTADSISAFALDSGPLILPSLPLEHGQRLFDREAPIVFDVTNDRLHVHVRHRDCRLDARARLMRVLREYAHNHSVHAGGLMLHAAAIARGGRGVALAGAKGAGKSTMAMRLLERAGTDFVANDRLLVRMSADDTIATGVPTIISFAERTRSLFPELASRLARLGDFREHAAERRPGVHHGMFDGPRWYLSAAQLCDVLGQRQVGTVPLAAILILAPPDDMSTQPIRRLPQEEAATALRENLLCRRSGRFISDVFVTERARGAAPDLEARCRALASQVPCYSVATSGDAIAMVDDHVQDLIDAIAAGYVAS